MSPNQVNVIPEHASAWLGRPGVEGSRAGRDWSATFRTTGQRLEDLADGGQRFVAEAADPVAGLEIVVELELTAAGLIRLRGTLTNVADEPYTVGAVRFALPVPAEADELDGLHRPPHDGADPAAPRLHRRGALA
jgi:alpha-galactosidase